MKTILSTALTLALLALYGEHERRKEAEHNLRRRELCEMVVDLESRRDARDRRGW